MTALRVGLTGNVAAGKSTVADRWRALGVPVLSADDVAREVVEPGTPGLEEVRAEFGHGVMAGDGSLDRAALRERVFSDDEARRRLESILHPRIRARRDAWIRDTEAGGAPLVVAEIPLLFETGSEQDFDVTVLVDAPEPVRLERIVEGRALSVESARAMMAAQMDPAEKRARADHVIDNDGTLAALVRSAVALLAQLREAVGVSWARLDLHLHTVGSWDCLSDPHAVLERALALGYQRIAITDHDRLDVALRMAEEFPERIVPGEEVRTNEGIDVIGLYLVEAIPKGTPALETVERIRAQGGIPYLPHPYAGGKGGGGRMADDLAAVCEVVEVFNARLHPGRLNEPAERLAERHGRLRGAGSDAHTIRELGGAWVDVPAHPNDPEGLRVALSVSRPGGRTASNLVHLASTWAKVRKGLRGSPVRSPER